ncbi:phosphoribose diphosphate:decaprenyl-phosphate phosphoribosyltransferase [Intrasporangium chromatireducens Q5-1]|uniref:Phosphoribose diphosphate:decaprenyl-phosphate phosphoribosyltransferase n=1 Tax=Intrasporangium chromatireducens Q5-1 TaxID=584657 RepID=W9GQ52_9MICO|nr:decaprenyl-phosphate phosphoribosyltransferase [Intrasporangium chromatireducens]EWT07177.1 phosphoribose diphosphate:decaprenyl-phosphate phosphoribosyltransferase [Intrasporangium chromatireducens Q5-1]
MVTSARAGAPSTTVALLQVLRPQLWPRNLLVAAAPIAAGTLLQQSVLLRTGQAFVALCLAASGAYCLNDVVDAPADARHPSKRLRPVASGRVRAAQAVVLSAVLMVASVVLAWPGSLRWVVVAYLLLTSAYSMGLKREPVVELAVVAGGFLLRAIAGGAATDTPISTWFLIVTGFGSLFMVTGKRLSELVTSGAASGTRSSLGAYSESYLRLVLGVSAAVAIAGYCLWAFGITTEGVESTYAALSVVPFVLAVLRYALDVDRARAQEPEHVVVGDRVLQVLALVWAVTFWLAAMT